MSFSLQIKFQSNFPKAFLLVHPLQILFANSLKPKECRKRLPTTNQLLTYQEGLSQITT
jgi:hypothetical protein